MKPKILTDAENNKLGNYHCPDCDWDLLIFGPHGGEARNAICGNCKTEFNRSEVQSERIGQPCSIERQNEVYQLDRFPVEKWPTLLPWREAALQQLKCSTPGCDGEHCQDEIILFSKCHPQTLVQAVYCKTENIVVLRCGACRRPILKIAVAE